MQTCRRSYRPAVTAGIMFIGFLASSAVAQDTPSVQELQRIIAEQQKKLEGQQEQLDAQRKLLLQLQDQMQSLIKSDETKAALEAADKPASPGPRLELAVPTMQRSVGLSAESKHDLISPTGANVAYAGSAITLLNPETKTEIGVHGFTQFQIIFDSNDINSNEFDTFLIPVDGAPSQTSFNVNPSRLGFSSMTPLGFGRINTLISMDLNGKLDSPDWRLREAYGEFIHDELDFAVLGGQTFSTMLDLKAAPETLDFAGPTGFIARRQPLVRFSKLFNHKFLLDIALDTPDNTVFINGDGRNRWPDFVVAGSWDFGSDYLKHIRIAGTIRDLKAESVFGKTDSAIGWAVSASTKVNLPFLGEKDNFKFVALYGDGYGGQLKSGPADAAFTLNPFSSELKTIAVFSTYGGLQHWWNDSWRSNLVFGYVDADNPRFIARESLKNTSYFAANLIWQLRKNITVGGEYLWGRLENESGESENANRFLVSLKYDF